MQVIMGSQSVNLWDLSQLFYAGIKRYQPFNFANILESVQNQIWNLFLCL
jgi:hypothetical protein